MASLIDTLRAAHEALGQGDLRIAEERLIDAMNSIDPNAVPQMPLVEAMALAEAYDGSPQHQYDDAMLVQRTHHDHPHRPKRLAIEVIPSGQEGYPDTYVKIDDKVTFCHTAYSSDPDDPEFPIRLHRALLALEEAMLPEGGPAVITTYLQSIE